MKRTMDIICAAAGIIFLSPLFLLLPLAIVLQSKGPALHRRTVIGKNGVPFKAYKFRTMVENAEEILKNNKELNEKFIESFKLRKDPRITRLGYFLRKFSLDEIPQFFNVLKGDMSLVGPRIMTEDELLIYGKWRDAVLSVRPGLSGLWQVSGRQEVSLKRRQELDIHYVNHMSLMKDICIILRTFKVVIKAQGAY